MTEQELNERIERMMIKVILLLAFTESMNLDEKEVQEKFDGLWNSWIDQGGKLPQQTWEGCFNLFGAVRRKKARND